MRACASVWFRSGLSVFFFFFVIIDSDRQMILSLSSVFAAREDDLPRKKKRKSKRKKGKGKRKLATMHRAKTSPPCTNSVRCLRGGVGDYLLQSVATSPKGIDKRTKRVYMDREEGEREHGKRDTTKRKSGAERHRQKRSASKEWTRAIIVCVEGADHLAA